MNAETPATLRRKEATASRNGAFALAASYQQERVELECEICHGEGSTERAQDSRLIQCRECEGEGMVRS